VDLCGTPVLPGVESTLVFTGESGAGGSGGCNQWVTDVKLGRTSIQFGAIGSTRMACEPEVLDQEQRYLTALADAFEWERWGDALHVHSQGRDGALRFASFDPETR